MQIRPLPGFAFILKAGAALFASSLPIPPLRSKTTIAIQRPPSMIRQAPRRSGYFVAVTLTGLVCLGTIIRFCGLGLRPMYDEAASWTFARLPWHSFWKAMWDYEGNMTLYYLILRLWVHLGDSQVILRSLSVLFGVATIPIVYLLGFRLFDRRAGLIAATLITVHAFHIRWSQEARSYAMAVFLISLSTLLLVSALKAARARRLWIAYVLVSSLACYSQMLAVLVLAAQWIWILANGFPILRSRIVVLASQLLLVAPVGLYAIFKTRGQLAWVPALSFDGFLDVLRQSAGAAGTGPRGTAASMFLYGGLCLLGVLLGYTSSERSTRLGTTLLLLWSLVPLGVITLVSAVKPMLVDRFVLLCLPASLLLAGSAIDSMLKWGRMGQWVGAFAGFAVLSLSLYDSLALYRTASKQTDNYRAMTRCVLSEQQPGDAAIFYTPAAHMSFRYYATLAGAARTPTVVFPNFGDAPTGAQPVPSPEQIEAASAAYPRVWLVLDWTSINLVPAWKDAVPPLYQALEQNFTLEEEQTAGKFQVFLYSHKR
jgi:mannosyltransferase